MSSIGKNEKKKDNRNIINQTPSKNVYCRYKDFMRMPQYSLDKVIDKDYMI